MGDITHQADVKVGQVWTAKVGDQLTKVKIISVEHYPGIKLSTYTRNARTSWIAINLATGKQVHIKSAAKLRRLVVYAAV